MSTRRSTLCCRLPRAIEVERGEHGSNVVEMTVDVIGTRRFDAGRFGLAVSLTDGNGEASLLLGEQIGSDLVVVVQPQQLATLPLQIVNQVTGAAGVPSAGLGGRRSGPLELQSDGRLELLVVADELQAQDGSPMQTDVRAAGLGATLSPVLAPVEPAALAVAVDGHEPVAQTTAHLARKQVRAAGPALDPAPVARAANCSGVMMASWRPWNHSPFISTSPR